MKNNIVIELAHDLKKCSFILTNTKYKKHTLFYDEAILFTNIPLTQLTLKLTVKHQRTNKYKLPENAVYITTDINSTENENLFVYRMNFDDLQDTSDTIETRALKKYLKDKNLKIKQNITKKTSVSAKDVHDLLTLFGEDKNLTKHERRQLGIY